jgi:hypothetical protein
VADVVGHLDLLAHDGDVVVEAKGSALRYRAAG